MLVNRKSWSRSVVTGSLAFLCAPLMICQSQANSPVRSALTAQTTPERVKELLVAAVFTTCPPRPGSKLPTMFINDWTLMEYDEAWSKLLLVPVKSADRLDGIQYIGLVIVSGSAYRYISGGRWSSRESPEVTSNVTYGDRILYDPPNPYAKLRIEKKNDKWSFFLNTRPTAIDPDEFSAKKASCSAAMSDSPQK